jgi:hypothetical protein
MLVPFTPNQAQRYYWDRRTRRNLILKARQKGISKIIDADQLVDCIKNYGTNAVVISHERESTQRLFSAVKFFIDNLKYRPTTSIDSRSEIKFPRMGSSYYIGTAGQKAFGRGDTLQRVHLSEAAWYPDLERILNGVSEAAEYGQIDIETTPNGRDFFYDLWHKAKAGRSSYTPIFIPWFIDDEFSVDSMTKKEKDGLNKTMQEMFAIPDDKFELSEDEKLLIKKVKAEWGINLTIGQIKWRRYKIWDKGDLFFQEYPEDDESCFLQTGRSVFHKIVLDPTRKIPLDNFEAYAIMNQWDPIRVNLFKKKRLYGAVDGAEGVQGGDSHCFSVIDVENGKGAVIFEITSTEPIDHFWLKVKKVMDNFNIFLGVEKNGVGVAHVQKAIALRIKHIEWETTGANRPIMISDLEEAYRKTDLIETYREAEGELRDMEYSDSNKPEAKKGKHDDRVLSRAIAWGMRNRAVPGVTFL